MNKPCKALSCHLYKTSHETPSSGKQYNKCMKNILIFTLLIFTLIGCSKDQTKSTVQTAVNKPQWTYLGKTVSQTVVLQGGLVSVTVVQVHCTKGDVNLQDRLLNPFVSGRDCWASEDGEWIKVGEDQPYRTKSSEY